MKSITFTIMLAAITFVAVSCQKTNDTSSGDENQLQASVTQNAADEYNVQTDEESLSADANTAVAVNPSFTVGSANTMDSAAIEGAVVDRTLITPLYKGIKIIYRGITVFGVTRSGQITVELVNGNSWIDAGAVLKITFDNVKITYLGKSLVFNGTRYVTNVSGGVPFLPLGPDVVVHKVRANGTVTFDDNTALTWWAARKNSYSKNDLSFSSEGDTLVNNESCSMGGINRYNANFLVKAPDAIVSNATCGFDKPVSGTRIFASENRNTALTFGVNANGSVVTGGNCAYGYKIEWTTWSGANATLIISY